MGELGEHGRRIFLGDSVAANAWKLVLLMYMHMHMHMHSFPHYFPNY